MAKTVKTMADLRAAVKRAQDSKDGLLQDMEDLQKRQQEFEKKAGSAAADGNTEAYISYKEQAARADAEAYVKAVQFKKTDSPVSEEEAEAAWSSYITPRNKEFETKYAAFMKTPDNMKEALLDLVTFLEESYNVRRECASAAGISITDVNGFSFNSEHFQMKDVGEHSLDKYFAVLNQLGLLSVGETTPHARRINTKL